ACEIETPGRQFLRERLSQRAPDVEEEFIDLAVALLDQQNRRRIDEPVDAAEHVERDDDADAVIEVAVLELRLPQRLGGGVAVGAAEPAGAELDAAVPA